jgi:hypothetical protein
VINGTATEAVSPWARFGARAATPVDRPLPRPAANAPAVSGKPRVTLENDPWARFDRAHPTTATGSAPARTSPAGPGTTAGETAHPLRAVPGGGSRASGPSTQSTRVNEVRPSGGYAVPRRTERSTETGPAHAVTRPPN